MHEECLKYRKGTLGYFYYSNIIASLLAELDARGANFQLVGRLIEGLPIEEYLSPPEVDLNQELNPGTDEVLLFTIYQGEKEDDN